MTDQTPPPPPSEPPYSAPAASNPYASPATPYAPGGPKPKQGLSLTSFILGLAGFVFSWIPFLGLLVAIAAVILGFLALSKEKGAPKWMWLVGLIAGGIGLIFALIVSIVWIAIIVAAANSGGSYSSY